MLVLNSNLTREQVNRDVGGSLIPHWHPDHVKATVIPILPEQKQIQIQQKIIESFRLCESKPSTYSNAPSERWKSPLNRTNKLRLTIWKMRIGGNKMSITQFTMEEVRCFAGRQEFNIRPLTFMVGENSTGKTTALACFQVLANYLCEREIVFNLDPYSMGTFKDIVRNSRKKEKVFTLGFTFRGENEDVECAVEFVEKEGGVEPVIKSITMKFTDGEIVFKIGDKLEWDARLVGFDEKQNQYRLDCGTNIFSSLSLGIFLKFLEGQSEGKIALAKFLEAHENSVSSIFGPWDIWRTISVFSTSPIRSHPQRTYDPTREFYDPEGSDVPMRLMQIQATRKKEWEALKGLLVEFGKRSGLFQNIEVKNLGGSMGNPFQLKVKVRGPNSNIIDVGYGVSQILPILVRIFDPHISPRPLVGPPFFLLQQPEVHLHPRAQAELSSLLAALASQGERTFIVETHSDYMIDRARVEIRKGNIRPEDVSLIYLEPKGRVVKVHNISFDKMGNMEEVPPHYREFFLKETDRLMGFED